MKLRLFVALVLGALCLCNPTVARSQSLIKSPTAHSNYSAELEPHVIADFVGEDHIGLGGRATFEIVDPGFVPSINDTVGIGVGFEWLNGREVCSPAPAPPGPPGVCRHYHALYLPVVMQWNFWFTPHWSAFGEPGLAFRFHDHDSPGPDDTDIEPVLGIGGRYNFNDRVSLTLRVGFPELSFGVSFFL